VQYPTYGGDGGPSRGPCLSPGSGAPIVILPLTCSKASYRNNHYKGNRHAGMDWKHPSLDEPATRMRASCAGRQRPCCSDASRSLSLRRCALPASSSHECEASERHGCHRPGQDVFFGCVESVRPCSLDLQHPSLDWPATSVSLRRLRRSGIPCRNDAYASIRFVTVIL
jgi:hypothetical protein